jgi:hypothetical protein
VLAGHRREPVRLGAGLRLAGPAASHPLRASRRVVLALLALGCAVSLLAPSPSSASSRVVPRDASWVGSQRPNHARRDQGPPRLTAAARSQPDAPANQGAFLLVLLVLALDAAAMVIRLVSSAPGWIKD